MARKSPRIPDALHNAPTPQRFKVYVAGQRRGLTAAVKRAFRRRSAVEPTIGHLKNEHRMGRNHLAGRAGDAANVVLAAVGYNFGLLLKGSLFCRASSWPSSQPQATRTDHRSVLIGATSRATRALEAVRYGKPARSRVNRQANDRSQICRITLLLETL